MKNLNFLHSLEVDQKFLVEEAEIIMRSQSLYGVERDFSVSFGLRPKLNKNLSSKVSPVTESNLSYKFIKSLVSGLGYS